MLTDADRMLLSRIATALEGINNSLGVLAYGQTQPGQGGRPQHNPATSIPSLLGAIGINLHQRR
ncbi:MAG TPA: hypothetical protein VGM88_09970 [Kofleriaceae bacterium]